MLYQLAAQFYERDVRLCRHSVKDQLGVLFDAPGSTIAALLLWREVTGLFLTITPSDGAGGAHPKTLRRCSARQATVNRGDNSLAKINGKRFGHACRPPSPACSLNQTRDRMGIPFDSFSSKNALEIIDAIRALREIKEPRSSEGTGLMNASGCGA
jgi:hypothetical protein